MHKLGHNKQGEKLGYDAKAATRFVKAVSVGDVQWHGGADLTPALSFPLTLTLTL